jgi:hypothetical protein
MMIVVFTRDDVFSSFELTKKLQEMTCLGNDASHPMMIQLFGRRYHVVGRFEPVSKRGLVESKLALVEPSSLRYHFEPTDLQNN